MTAYPIPSLVWPDDHYFSAKEVRRCGEEPRPKVKLPEPVVRADYRPPTVVCLSGQRYIADASGGKGRDRSSGWVTSLKNDSVLQLVHEVLSKPDTNQRFDTMNGQFDFLNDSVSRLQEKETQLLKELETVKNENEQRRTENRDLTDRLERRRRRKRK